MNEPSETVNPPVELLKLNPKQHRNFWRKVEKTDDCWIWIGCRTVHRYGRLTLNNKHAWAHRVSYEIHHGPIPPGLKVLHKCDNPPCVNPDHLFKGTMKDNSDDMMAKGRGRKATGDQTGARLHPEKLKRGSQHPHAKLTEAQVVEIRRLYATGNYLQKDIGTMFGIKQPNVDRIVKRTVWKHVV